MTTKRTRGWELRLIEHIKASRSIPFAWGSHDCALWAAKTYDVLCETRLVETLAPTYTTAEGAVAFMSEHGWTTLADTAEEVTGYAPLTYATEAWRGDLLFIPTIISDQTPWVGGALLICDGVSVLGPDTEGLRSLPFRALLMLGKGVKVFRV